MSNRRSVEQKLASHIKFIHLFSSPQEDFNDDDPELCYSRLLALNPKCRQGISTAREFISLLQTLVKSLASDELAHFCVGKEDVSDAKASARLEKQKSQLQDSLTRAGTAICGFAQTCSCPEEAAEVVQEAEKIHGLVKKWCDPREAKVTAFLTEFFIVKKLYASALRLLLKALEEKPSKETETKMIQVSPNRQQHWVDVGHEQSNCQWLFFMDSRSHGKVVVQKNISNQTSELLVCQDGCAISFSCQVSLTHRRTTKQISRDLVLLKKGKIMARRCTI